MQKMHQRKMIFAILPQTYQGAIGDIYHEDPFVEYSFLNKTTGK